jgi:signal transduction histidine kinase
MPAAASILWGTQRVGWPATMLVVSSADGHDTGDRRRRLVAAPRAPAVVGGALASLAVAEAAARAVLTDTSVQGGVVLCVLALATTVPVALLGPVPAAVAIAASATVSLALFETLTVAGALAQVVVVAVAGHRSARPAVALLGLPFVVLAVAGSPGSEAWVLTVLLAALVPAAALAGVALRARADADDLRAARRDLAGSLVEHAARGERARISRELHDVVAHHISMIAVEAETARLTTPGLPAAGADRLSAIGDTARTALTEMRRLLGVLREDTDDDSAERQPQPDLRQLNDLLDAAREASGTASRLIVSGPTTTLDPGVEVAAYRIVQEALTNARRHAPGAAVDVELRYRDGGSLLLRVRDNGPGPAAAGDGHGHGLRGMRERAAAVGGDLRTSMAPGGGFLVTAELPGPAENDR